MSAHTPTVSVATRRTLTRRAQDPRDSVRPRPLGKASARRERQAAVPYFAGLMRRERCADQVLQNDWRCTIRVRARLTAARAFSVRRGRGQGLSSPCENR